MPQRISITINFSHLPHNIAMQYRCAALKIYVTSSLLEYKLEIKPISLILFNIFMFFGYFDVFEQYSAFLLSFRA